MVTKHKDDLEFDGNKSVATDLKEHAETSRITRAAERAAGAPIAGGRGVAMLDMQYVPQDGEDLEAFNYAANAEKERERAEAYLQAELDEQALELQFFIACRYRRQRRLVSGKQLDQGPHHGLYLKSAIMPGAEVGMHDWYMRGKKVEDTWHKHIACQECANMGVLNLLQVRILDFAKGIWVPDTKMIWCFPKDPAWYAKVGPFRAVDTGLVAANTGRLAALEKLAELRAQKVG